MEAGLKQQRSDRYRSIVSREKKKKRSIYVREARTKYLLLRTDTFNQKTCTLSYSQKGRVFALERLST